MSKPWVNPRGEYVSRMFGAIADRYDLMNRVMTVGQDQRWRRQAADLSLLDRGQSGLDIATGTGDLAFELAKRVGPDGEIVAVDFSEPMLTNSRKKNLGRRLPVKFKFADMLDLPFADDTFHAVTCGFGLRNVDARERALDEMVRVVRPGRRVVILELTPPANSLARTYMDEVIPRLGQLLAHARDAYTYLPESVQEFPRAEVLGRMMQQSGLREVTYRHLNFGTVALHWGTKR